MQEETGQTSAVDSIGGLPWEQDRTAIPPQRWQTVCPGLHRTGPERERERAVSCTLAQTGHQCIKKLTLFG